MHSPHSRNGSTNCIVFGSGCTCLTPRVVFRCGHALYAQGLQSGERALMQTGNGDAQRRARNNHQRSLQHIPQRRARNTHRRNLQTHAPLGRAAFRGLGGELERGFSSNAASRKGAANAVGRATCLVSVRGGSLPPGTLLTFRAVAAGGVPDLLWFRFRALIPGGVPDLLWFSVPRARPSTAVPVRSAGVRKHGILKRLRSKAV